MDRPRTARQRQFGAWEEGEALTREHVERMRAKDAAAEKSAATAKSASCATAKNTPYGIAKNVAFAKGMERAKGSSPSIARAKGSSLAVPRASDVPRSPDAQVASPARADDIPGASPARAGEIPGAGEARALSNAGDEHASADPAGFVLHVLASGSKGNASIVQLGDAAILVDCGITKKALFERCDAVGFDPFSISAVLVTHEHTDHTKGLGVLYRAFARQGVHPPLVTTAAVRAASAPIREVEGLTDVRSVRASDDFMLAGLHVVSFATSHDAAESMGFRFEGELPSRANGVAGKTDALGYATDSGVLSDEAVACLSDVRLLALESNHDARLLDIGPYPSHLKRRVASDFGHLSNAQSAAYLERLLSARLERVAGMHLSETNNEPQLAMRAAEGVLERACHSARWTAAAQHRAVTLW